MTGDVFTVALDPADAATSRLHQTVLASLPARFSVAGNSSDVWLISGDQPGWAERARSAIRAGARAIVLAGTRSLTADSVGGLGGEASAANVLVTVAMPYAADPGWVAALPMLGADVTASAVLDSIITAPPGAALRTALTSQLAVIRQLLPGLDDLKTAHADHLGYVLAGGTPEIAITLSGTASGIGDHRLDLDLAGSGRRWHACLRAGAPAFPSRITVSDTRGDQTMPLVYESGHRATWAELHEAIRARTVPGYSADQLARDLATAEAALGPATAS
jgi:hypothetical protein